uniref:Uncharacterized protein n=1 Tax=Arundo donax TaxID=35708 RepID=A0A0A9AF06_ARUDO
MNIAHTTQFFYEYCMFIAARASIKLFDWALPRDR